MSNRQVLDNLISPVQPNEEGRKVGRTRAPFSSGFGNLTVGKSGSGEDCCGTSLSEEEGKLNSVIRRWTNGRPTPCIGVKVNIGGVSALSLLGTPRVSLNRGTEGATHAG